MKIIRHTPRRRPHIQIPEIIHEAPSVPQSQQKKALLIGINYGAQIKRGKKKASRSGGGSLKGPHKDVQDMRELLINYYNYDPKDIVTLVDRDGSPDTQPTRANILLKIDWLVTNAKAGDRFFFHFSGHSMQIENKNHSEEDNMDECIVPVDGERQRIQDNELRKVLVDRLPVGSSLFAIFDSCHSESLLDLQHYRCNRIYVPWTSKGKRKSDFLRNSVVRRMAMDSHIDVVLSRAAASQKPSVERFAIPPTPQAQRMPVNSRSLSIQSSVERWGIPGLDTPIPICESPVALFPCNGFCEPTNEVRDAYVVALASCKDGQEAWEDADGKSMTQALIRILKQNPHPTLHDLMTDISHALHEAMVRMHTETRSYKKKMKDWLMKKRGVGNIKVVDIAVEDAVKLEMDNFQDPQLSSHHPLNMQARFDI